MLDSIIHYDARWLWWPHSHRGLGWKKRNQITSQTGSLSCLHLRNAVSHARAKQIICSSEINYLLYFVCFAVICSQCVSLSPASATQLTQHMPLVTTATKTQYYLIASVLWPAKGQFISLIWNPANIVLTQITHLKSRKDFKKKNWIWTSVCYSDVPQCQSF